MEEKASVRAPASGPKPTMTTKKIATITSWKLRETVTAARHVRYTADGTMLRAAPKPRGIERAIPATVATTVIARLSMIPSLMS